MNGEPLTPIVSVNGTQIPIEQLEALIDERVDQIREELGNGDYRAL